MNIRAQKFLDLLEAKNAHGRVTREDENDTVVRVGFKGKSTNVEVLLIFPNKGDYVWLRSFDLVNVPEDKFAQALLACNRLNKEYRWVKFFIDEEDNTISVSDDAKLDEASCAEESFELMLRMIDIADEAYGVIMKAIYA